MSNKGLLIWNIVLTVLVTLLIAGLAVIGVMGAAVMITVDEQSEVINEQSQIINELAEATNHNSEAITQHAGVIDKQTEAIELIAEYLNSR